MEYLIVENSFIGEFKLQIKSSVVVDGIAVFFSSLLAVHDLQRQFHRQLCHHHPPPLPRLLDGQEHHRQNHGRAQVH